MMTRSTGGVVRLAVAVLCVTAAAHLASPRLEAGADSLKLTVTYSGKGSVDAQHRIWIWLFDNPNIGPGSDPIAEQSLDSNGGAVTFDVSGSVWIAAAYDATGGFAGGAPPASGTPVGIYAGENGAPAAVVVSGPTEAALRFDDSMRMP